MHIANHVALRHGNISYFIPAASDNGNSAVSTWFGKAVTCHFLNGDNCQKKCWIVYRKRSIKVNYIAKHSSIKIACQNWSDHQNVSVSGVG